MVEYTIKAALGEECHDLSMVKPNGFGLSYSISSQKRDILKELKLMNIFKEENIVELYIISKFK